MSRGIAHGSAGDGPRPQRSATVVDLESIRSYFTAMVVDARSKIRVETLRPLPVFLGISGQHFCLAQDAFGPPTTKLDKSTLEKVRTRLKLNFAYFISNYALVAAGVALVVALMHPGMLISLGTLWALWELHAYLISHELIVFGRNIGAMMSIRHRSNVLMVLSAVVVVWKCLRPTVTFVAITGLIVFSHAMMRDPKQMNTANANRRQGAQSDEEYDSSGSEVVVDHPTSKADII